MLLNHYCVLYVVTESLSIDFDAAGGGGGGGGEDGRERVSEQGAEGIVLAALEGRTSVSVDNLNNNEDDVYEDNNQDEEDEEEEEDEGGRVGGSAEAVMAIALGLRGNANQGGGKRKVQPPTQRPGPSATLQSRPLAPPPQPPPPQPAAPVDPNECVICMASQRDALLYSCGHVVGCFKCSVALRNSRNPVCPICREVIKDVVRVFQA